MSEAMYKEIIDSYFASLGEEPFFSTSGTVWIPSLGLKFKSCQDCFESHIKHKIEDGYSPFYLFDFSIFTEKQLDFLEECQLGTNIEEQLDIYSRIPDMTVSFSECKLSENGHLQATAKWDWTEETICVNLNIQTGEIKVHFGETSAALSCSPYRNIIQNRCKSKLISAYHTNINPLLRATIETLNEQLKSIDF